MEELGQSILFLIRSGWIIMVLLVLIAVSVLLFGVVAFFKATDPDVSDNVSWRGFEVKPIDEASVEKKERDNDHG